MFSTGTLFVAKVCLPHEQSVGGAVFQTLTQLGTAFGLAISTVVFNSTLNSRSRALGVSLNADGSNAPTSAQLTAYKDAMWTGFAFGVFGASPSFDTPPLFRLLRAPQLGALLALAFLRGVGVVGHRKGQEDEDAGSEKTALEPAP